MELIREINSDQSGDFELVKPNNFIDAPAISVVMSVYNGQKYLRESVDSILNQTCKSFEFIIINDGSEDNSLDILLDYQTKDNRLLIVNQNNIGLTRSLNRGIRVAASEYIARQDADDISLPTRFEKQLNYMENHPEVAVIGCLGDVFSVNGILRTTKDTKYSRDGIKRHLASKNLFMHGSAMMRKSCLAKVGFYREFFRHSQDYDLWLRLSQYSDIDILPEHLYQYRVTPEAISVSRWSIQKQYADIARKLHAEQLAVGRDSYDMFVRSYPDGLPVCEDKAGKCEYHLFLARELVGGNKLKDARRQLRQLWQLGCRRPEMLFLLLKSLLGETLLNLLRRLRALIFEMDA
ncbi:MAG: glycosyltransferase [Phycisphaerae bacterium]|nr:glycosyltransferase [Phycisphaerae bacterium]MDD5381709.1 glycosyltransferase [Phycisphaerae bacterium]